MIYKLINMLLTLEAIKEIKINHISAADQKPKSFFPHAAKLSVRIRIHTVYFCILQGLSGLWDECKC
mgnify:FL=1